MIAERPPLLYSMILALGLLLGSGCGEDPPAQPGGCLPGADCELGEPLNLAQPSAPNAEPGTRLIAYPLSPGPYVVLAWACLSLPGGAAQDATLQIDPGSAAEQTLPVPTPACTVPTGPVRWQGEIHLGCNLVAGSADLPSGTTFSAVVLAFPLLTAPIAR